MKRSSLCMLSLLALSFAGGTASADHLKLENEGIRDSKSGYLGADNQMRSTVNGNSACPAGFDFDKSNKQCRKKSDAGGTAGVKYVPVRRTAGKAQPYHSPIMQQGKRETALGGPDTADATTSTGNARGVGKKESSGHDTGNGDRAKAAGVNGEPANRATGQSVRAVVGLKKTK